MKDPYAVLGLGKDADPDLLRSKYNELHELYSEQRFKAGEEGNEGARKLQELEEAWIIISANLDSKKEEFGGDYGQIDNLIRAGRYNEAQDILDSISDRRGEWHYMQAIVFYKREWLTEAKTQLEMALQDEPNNAKYKNSLDKLKISMQDPAAQAMAQAAPVNANNRQGSYGEQTPQDQAGDLANCLSSCCCAYCLTDCLCSTLRCC